ncbi:MAG: aldehyde ferredoxin oxidoreductase C-terminal domain-containing protein [Anaerolineales bacterium]|jgi:aldehyde:ferredoxin oxidoreductase
MPSSNPKPYHSQVWRVDIHERTLKLEPVPPTWERLGGRGLIARILVDEVVPTCEPLGPKNKLIFAPGLLVGHMLSSLDRISLGGKSPLTGGVKESNAGGSTGLHLTSMGIKALILEGWPKDPGWSVLHLSSQGARFDPADDLAGLGAYDSAKRLVARYGDKVAISLIGPGGEMKMVSAGICNLDKDGTPSRLAARGGLGALMGSKGLKAIVFDASDGQKPPIANLEAFRATQKIYNKFLMEHPQTKIYSEYGTPAMVPLANGFGGLPTRNFSSGVFEQAEQIGGENMRALILSRGGEGNPTHACMSGCVIRCSNVFADQDGKTIVGPLEFETVGLLGPNLGIGSLDSIARLNWQANDIGLDSIEMGAALGVAAEAGMMNWGDEVRALELVDEIRRNTPLGRILGSGAAWTGKILGIEHVPVVKGQAMSAYEPRALKGTGVTFATTPQGADHTCGQTIRDKINHLDPKGQVALSRAKQISMAGYDTLGACIFAAFGFAVAPPETIRDLINARYGWGVGTDILQVLGKQTIKLELEFNRGAGFTKAHDRIPEWMTREPLPPHNVVFDVPDEEMDTIFDW